MSNVLDGEYDFIDILGDTCYFLSVAEGNRVRQMIAMRDEMSPEDRRETCQFTDLAGRNVIMFIREIACIMRSTPETRDAVEDINKICASRNPL